MSNIKSYYISSNDWAAIKASKMSLQAKQLYESLSELGKPTRGVEIVAYAVNSKGLVTKQDYAVLAAWYFSSKRRPTQVTLDIPAIVAPVIEDTTKSLPAELELAE